LLRCCCCCCQGEKLLYKPGKGAFYATDLEPWLHSKGISHLLVAGAAGFTLKTALGFKFM
jgi:nicotinamidase-related amidase